MYWCHNNQAPQGELLTPLLNGAGKVSWFTVLTLILLLVRTEPTFPLQCTVKHATTKCRRRRWRSVETDNIQNTIYSTVLPLWRGLHVLPPELRLVKQTWIAFVFLHLWWVLLRYKQSPRFKTPEKFRTKFWFRSKLQEFWSRSHQNPFSTIRFSPVFFEVRHFQRAVLHDPPTTNRV